MAFNPKEQRRIMGMFATGVTVATTKVNDETWGMTANAVASLSLDPPLVLLAVVRDSQSHTQFKDGGCFALNILSTQQEAVSTRFASSGPKDLTDLDTKTAITGAPVLNDALGWVDCEVSEILPGGDHDIFIGKIVSGDARDGDPLLFYAGKYARIAKED